MFKEDLIPGRSDPFVFKLAPFLADPLIPAFLVFAVIPVAGNFSDGADGVVTIFGHETFMQVADPQMGILFVLAMSSVAVYGVMLAGWSSGSKYPLLGSVRASAQMVSYEASLGLVGRAVLLFSGTLSTNGIVAGQSGGRWNLWMTALVPFVIFIVSATAELNRPPFDLVEAEQELVGGFHTEYSSFRCPVLPGRVQHGHHVGGHRHPVPGRPVGSDPDWALAGRRTSSCRSSGSSAKLLIFLFMFVWFRPRCPASATTSWMDLGWKFLIPLSLGWFLILTSVKVAIDIAGTRSSPAR